jgi:Ca2+-binding EF-hand superfamily protein
MVSSPDRLSTDTGGSNKNAGTLTAMTTLSTSELQELRDAFALFDTEQTGKISTKELRSVLRELQQESDALPSSTSSSLSSSSSHLRRLASSLDGVLAKSDDQLLLSAEDFVRLLTTPNPADTRDEIEKVYDLFDANGKGYIDLQDLRQVAKDLGEHSMSDVELQEMLHRASSSSSSSSDGNKVTIDQFRDIMNKKLFS